MLAWIRTGIALMAFGFAIARFGVFLRQVANLGQAAVRSQHGVGSWVGAGLVALGMLANLLATIRYAQIAARSSAEMWALRVRRWCSSSEPRRR
jgi:putative membrane protein